MISDCAFFSEVYVFDDGVPRFYIRIPRGVCKSHHIRSRMILTVSTQGGLWSAPCELRISPNRHYIRVPSRVALSGGFSPGEVVAVRLVSVSSSYHRLGLPRYSAVMSYIPPFRGD